MAVTLTGYGGVGEIGGNAFLLDDGKSCLFLDFGRRFGSDPKDDSGSPGIGDYFDEYLKPRSHRMALDLITLGLVPEMPSLYRPDIGGTPGPAGIDGVLISHAHADHCGLIGMLKPDVPVFLSQESRATLASLQETGTGGVDGEFVAMRAKGYARNGPRGRHPVSTNPAKTRPLVPRRLEDATDAHAGSWAIQQYVVDHSIHGARASIISGRDVSIAYTGDFRRHGRLRHETERFLERAGGVDVLITEGTNVGQSHKHGGDVGESDVEAQIEDLARGEPGLVAIAFPPRDLDRFQSIHAVAKRLGRRLAITTKQAHLLESLRAAGRSDLPDPRTDTSLAIHIRNRGRGTLAEKRGVLTLFGDDGEPETVDVGIQEWDRVLASEYASWERPYLECGNTASSAAIGATPEEWMFSISYWSITDLIDIFPRERPGGLYIHSMTQPFNDDMEISDRKLRRWLRFFRLRHTETHVSGHLSEKDLEHAMDAIGARLLVPVHSLHPDLTADRYQRKTGHRALLPLQGKALDIA